MGRVARREKERIGSIAKVVGVVGKRKRAR